MKEFWGQIPQNSVLIQTAVCESLVGWGTTGNSIFLFQVISHIGDFLANYNSAFCATFVGGTKVVDDIRKLESGVIVTEPLPAGGIQRFRPN